MTSRRSESYAHGLADGILIILRKRFGEPPGDIEKRILESDADLLDRVLDHVISSPSLHEFLCAYEGSRIDIEEEHDWPANAVRLELGVDLWDEARELFGHTGGEIWMETPNPALGWERPHAFNARDWSSKPTLEILYRDRELLDNPDISDADRPWVEVLERISPTTARSSSLKA